MSLGRFLPWQTEIARSWLSGRDRFAHAWLIHGNGGIGKLDFTAAAAASLLCESPRQGLACGECAACAWVASGNHPDLRRIRPEAVALEEGADQTEGAEEAEAGSGGAAAKRAPSKDIRIDQIRALEPWFNTATHRGGWRVALLYPAHALNVISANALLKVLEEPPAHTVFLLVADAPDRLLPTLVSRCRRLPLPTPSAGQALQWLGEQGVEPAADLAGCRRRRAAGGAAPGGPGRCAVPGLAGATGAALGRGQGARCGHADRKPGKGGGGRVDRRPAAPVHRPDAGRPWRGQPLLSLAGRAGAASRRARAARATGRDRALAEPPARAGHASAQRQAVRARGPAARGAILPVTIGPRPVSPVIRILWSVCT
ncbi:DNA polymerase III, delta' subunit [Bordetella pertussis 2356847]|nr:DNA polymerase III, delta' subunit [Bordetella pertussis 2356847]